MIGNINGIDVLLSLNTCTCNWEFIHYRYYLSRS